MVVTLEHTPTNDGCVTLEIDSCQAGAAKERIIPDAADAAGDCVASGFTSRICEERALALVEQDPSHAGIDGIERIRYYRAQASATREGTISDAGDAAGDGHAGQAGAARECIVRDPGHAAADCVASSFAFRIYEERAQALVE